MAQGNSNIAILGMDTQFGKEHGPDPSTAARRKNQEAHTSSVRLALRRLAGAEFDVAQSLTLEELVKKFGREGTVISGAQMLAARKFLLALKGNVSLMQQVTDDIDGKLVQASVEARTTLADLVNASVALERQQEQVGKLAKGTDKIHGE
jgi:hypothetical protein